MLNLRNGNHTRKLPIRPEDVITKEDVAHLVKHCTNYRNEAIVVTLYESAARVGEFVKMNIGHLKFDDKGIVLIVEGKTGQRRIRLVESVPYIQKWLENHPLKDNKEAPLWCSLYSPYERIQEQTVYVFLKGLKKRKKFEKHLNPHAFRHSRLTELSKYLSDSKLKVFAGWAASSRMCGVYVHLSGSDLENDLLRIAGVETKEQKMEVSPLKVKLCTRCQAKNAGTNEFCHRCGYPFNKELLVKETLETQELKEKYTVAVEGIEGMMEEISKLRKEMEELKKH